MASTSGTPQPYNPGFSIGSPDGSVLNALFAQPDWSYEYSITATAGGTQVTSYLLRNAISQVTVSATAADGVKLPPAVPGVLRLIINDGASSIQIFPTAGDTIDGVASATGVAMAAAKRGWFVCVAPNKWVSWAAAKSS